MKGRISSFIVISCFLTLSSIAQDKTFIKVNPFTVPNQLEVYLTKDYSPAFSLEVGAGFIFTDYWDYLLNKIDFGQIKPNLSSTQYLQAKGFGGKIGFRFYLLSPESKRRLSGIYFEPLFLYKQVWYPKNEKDLNDENYLDKGEKKVYGLQLLIGRQHQWHSLYLDKYVGLGVKAKDYQFDNFQINQIGGVENNGTRTTSWVPEIKLGVKLAWEVGKKKRLEEEP